MNSQLQLLANMRLHALLVLYLYTQVLEHSISSYRARGPYLLHRFHFHPNLTPPRNQNHLWTQNHRFY
jgi:hypothetical protein